MPTETNHEASRNAAIRGLAIVGFIALIALGMWLAVYSARYVPSAVSHLNGAAVSIASIFNKNTPTLEVISTGTSTPNTNVATSTASSTPTTATTTKPVTEPSTGTHTGTPQSHVYPVGTSTPATAPLTGYADLSIAVGDVGYLSTLTPDSFVSSTTTIARGMRPAVKFTIRNIGTNVMQAGWRFTAYLPTLNSYLFQSAPQQALYPGDSIDYTMGFDQPLSGQQTITITANSDNYMEATRNNNVAKVPVTIGS